MKVYFSNDESLIGWTPLIKASPFLHKFTLEDLTWRKMPKVRECPHQCLKVVELVGCSSDIELVMYLLASTRALEKIGINCSRPYFVGQQRREDEEKAAKNHALWQKRKLPPGVEIVVV